MIKVNAFTNLQVLLVQLDLFLHVILGNLAIHQLRVVLTDRSVLLARLVQLVQVDRVHHELLAVLFLPAVQVNHHFPVLQEDPMVLLVPMDP